MGKLSKVIDCYGTWCGPCKVYATTFEKVSEDEKYKDIQFERMDVEDESVVDLVEKWQIKNLPTTVFLDEDGNIMKRLIGNVPRKDLEFTIDLCLNKNE